jgi:hypothetical protein
MSKYYLDLGLNMSKKFKPCLKKLRACLICRKRPNGHQVVTNGQSFLKFKVTFYTLFVSAKCDTLEKGVEKIILKLAAENPLT